jgi:hypothetical protein
MRHALAATDLVCGIAGAWSWYGASLAWLKWTVTDSYLDDLARTTTTINLF